MKILNGVLMMMILLMSLTSCGRRVIIRKYYLLENPRLSAPADPAAPQPLPFNVDVRDFQVGKAFDQTRIAARSGSNELDYYFYHHWAVRPSIALADMSHELIDRAGLFQRCVRGYSYRPDFIITGYIMRLERLLEDGGDDAHLAIVFQLIDTASELQAVRHESDRTTTLEGDGSMNAFAEAVSRLAYQEATVFAEKIIAHFEQKQE